MKRFFKTLGLVVLRELKIIRIRPIFLLASVVVLAFNAFFYTTFLRDGLPHDMPIGVVDMDHSSTSRNFASQLDKMAPKVQKTIDKLVANIEADA